MKSTLTENVSVILNSYFGIVFKINNHPVCNFCKEEYLKSMGEMGALAELTPGYEDR